MSVEMSAGKSHPVVIEEGNCCVSLCSSNSYLTDKCETRQAPVHHLAFGKRSITLAHNGCPPQRLTLALIIVTFVISLALIIMLSVFLVYERNNSAQLEQSLLAETREHQCFRRTVKIISPMTEQQMKEHMKTFCPQAALLEGCRRELVCPKP